MQEETVFKPDIPQGEHILTNNYQSEPFINGSGNTSFKRNRNFHGKNQFYQYESVRIRMIKKFLKIVGTMVGVFLLAGTIAVFIINGSQANHDEDIFKTPLPSTVPTDIPPGETPIPEPTDSPDPILLPPVKTNFLVVGKDAGDFLTDVILVGCFDRETHDISIISVPRDTFIVIPPPRLKRMYELGLYPPSDGIMKINAVNSYGGEKYGIALLKEQLQDLLNIDIEFQVEVDLLAFRNIVDALGGVYFEVPSPGMYYNDPFQDLVIAIPPGFQYLDGVNAEGVVRYRATYREGDIQRISVQHQFLKAFFSQVLERENIINNALSISKAVIGYTKTNIGIGDIPKYIRYINDVSADKIHFYILPCTPEDIGGLSYVIPNDKQIQELVKDVFYKVAESEQSPAPITTLPPTQALPVSSKGLRIEILNGSNKQGLAGTLKEALENDGFTVTNIDTYYGAQLDQTQILVRTAGIGSDLKKYFKDVIIQVTPDMPADYDIIVITGRGEA